MTFACCLLTIAPRTQVQIQKYANMQNVPIRKFSVNLGINIVFTWVLLSRLQIQRSGHSKHINSLSLLITGCPLYLLPTAYRWGCPQAAKECPQVMCKVCHQAMSTLLVSNGVTICKQQYNSQQGIGKHNNKYIYIQLYTHAHIYIGICMYIYIQRY